MGFFDSFQKGVAEENQRSAERQARSEYRTLEQQEMDHYDKFDRQNDGTLLRKIRGGLVSDKDKKVIEQILENRGYREEDGKYSRW